MVIKIVLLVILSYLFGSFNISIALTRKKQNDITKLGSGNPGTLNMLRNFGLTYGLISIAYDVLKGLIPSLIGYALLKMYNLETIGTFLGGLSSIIGHMFPIYYGFKGGKGIATSVGMFIVASPLMSIFMFVLMVVVIFLLQCGSVATLSYIATMCIFEFMSVPSGSYVCYILISLEFVLIFWAHRKNLIRIFTGKEAKTNLKGTILNAVNSLSVKINSKSKKQKSTEKKKNNR